LVEIPLPSVRCDQRGIVTCDAIESPVSRGNMNIIVSAICGVRCGLVPGPPDTPVDSGRVGVSGKGRGLIIVDGLKRNKPAFYL
jgi:hypothetical protein